MSVGRVVSVGDALTWSIPLDSEVLVMPTYTLVRSREGRVYRLIERDGEVHESPMSSEQRAHVLDLFGR